MQTEKQRERLVELLNEATYQIAKACIGNCEGCGDKIADYLIANNVVVTPMKLGQNCFNPCSYRNDVDECRVSSITQKVDGTFKIRLTNLRGKWVFEITEDEIGKQVFLSMEEAENVLKEREEKN